MSTNRETLRLINTANDFDVVGLVIIGYYLRLYAVELLISDKERSEDATKTAYELLDTIEAFKSEYSTFQPGTPEANLHTLITNQNKAMIYVTNFTMSLYNEKLIQVKDGPFNADLKRGLWCCIDLLNCILGLWKEQLSDEATIKKKIKYCKVYLSKLNKGELGPYNSTSESSEAHETFTNKSVESRDNEISDNVNDNVSDNESVSVSDKISVNCSLNEKPQINKITPVEDQEPTEDDINGLLEQLKMIDDEGEGEVVPGQEPRFIDSDEELYERKENHNSRSATPELTSEASSESKEEQLPKPTSESKEKETLEPTSDSNQGLTPEPASESLVSRTYSREDLENMMDRSGKIEKVQKLAKYAISALNYDDTVTARDELIKALALLDSLSK